MLTAQNIIEVRFLFMAKQQNLTAVITHEEHRCIIRPVSRQQGKCHIDTGIDIGKSHEAKGHFLARFLINDMVITMKLLDSLFHSLNIRLPGQFFRCLRLARNYDSFPLHDLCPQLLDALLNKVLMGQPILVRLLQRYGGGCRTELIHPDSSHRFRLV